MQLGRRCGAALYGSGRHCRPGLFEALRSLAEAGGIPWQTMRSVAGRTDTAAIQRTKEGVRTAAVSIPVRYPRTPSGVTCLRDAEAALA